MITTGIEEYALVYADDREQLNPLENLLQKETGVEPMYVDQISTVVGLNAGRGAIAVAYIKGEES